MASTVCRRNLLLYSPRAIPTWTCRGFKTAQVRDKEETDKDQSSSRIPKFAFAFDIDGVLLRSSSPLPGARKALSILKDQHIPFILLTNGGGKLESERVQELSHRLELRIDESLFIQSHTPYAQLGAEKQLLDKHILIIGGEGNKCRSVAQSYGFQHVIIPSDIFHAHPEIWPFSAQFADYHARAAKPLPLPLFIPSESKLEPQEGKHLKIDAIFVYNDPRDMGLDIQLVIDLLLSYQGFLGTVSKTNGRKELPNHGYILDSQPPLYFANPDIFWAGQYQLPRLGSGAFKASLQGLWREITGGSDLGLNLITGGKPSDWTYRFADTKLGEQWSRLHTSRSFGDRLERIYMVGDNIASDIIGANQFMSPHDRVWMSYLVRTGVWNGETPIGNSETPTETVHGVYDAVTSVLKREHWSL